MAVRWLPSPGGGGEKREMVRESQLDLRHGQGLRSWHEEAAVNAEVRREEWIPPSQRKEVRELGMKTL